MITIATYDLQTKDSCTKNSCMKRRCFQGFSTTFGIRPAIWLHSVHEIAVPISRSPQCSIGQKCILRSEWLCITSRPIFKGDVVRWLSMYTSTLGNYSRRFELIKLLLGQAWVHHTLVSLHWASIDWIITAKLNAFILFTFRNCNERAYSILLNNTESDHEKGVLGMYDNLHKPSYQQTAGGSPAG